MIFYIILIVLVLILILLVIKNKENISSSCDITNCGKIKYEDECLSCDNCGIYTDRRDYKYCTNGNIDNPIFLEDWKSWQYQDNPIKYNLNSPGTKLYDEYTRYLDALDKIYSTTPMPIYN